MRRVYQQLLPPQHMRRKLEYSLRTVYCVLLCVLLAELFPWSGRLTYLSPTLAAVGASLTLGQALQKLCNVSISAAIGSAVGTIIGLTYHMTGLQLVLLFCCMVWLNRTSLFDQSGKVIGLVCMILGALLPNLTSLSHSRSGEEVLLDYLSIAALAVVPFLLTACTLLFPVPKLAVGECVELASLLNRSCSRAITALVSGFNTAEYTALHSAEVEYVLHDMSRLIPQLQQLLDFCEYECLLLPSLAPSLRLARLVLQVSERVRAEVESVKEFSNSLLRNKTQLRFVACLSGALDALSRDVEDATELVNELLHTNRGPPDEEELLVEQGGADGLPPSAQLPVDEFSEKDDDEESASRRESRKHYSARSECESEPSSGSPSTPGPRKGRRRVDAIDRDALPSSLTCSLAALRQGAQQLLLSYTETRRVLYMSFGAAEDSSASYRRGTTGSSAEAEMRVVSIRLNIGLRHCFISRMLAAIEALSAYSAAAEAVATTPLIAGLRRALAHSLLRGWGHAREYGTIGSGTAAYALELLCCLARGERGVGAVARELLQHAWRVTKIYIQAIKISLAIVIMAIFVVTDVEDDLSQNGIWATVVIALVRQESSSSSFLMGYQRLEGTVIGSVYTYAMSIAFRCYEHECQLDSRVIIITIWLFVCAYFREGRFRGYAAVVAGFTPIVLLNGSLSQSKTAAFQRIEKTFLGIGIYLLIDNLVFPRRIDTSIRVDVLRATDESIAILEGCVDSVSSLLAGEEPDPDFSRRLMQSDLHNEAAATGIASLERNLQAQEVALQLVVMEPELWYRPFPLATYSQLLVGYRGFLQCGREVSSSVGALRRSIAELLTAGSSSIGFYIETFSFMITQVMLVSRRALVALKLAKDALQKIFAGEGVDMMSILTLSQYIDRMLEQIDAHFGSKYLSDTERIAALDTSFLLGWSACFEGMCKMVRALQLLGLALHAVRETEIKHAR